MIERPRGRLAVRRLGQRVFDRHNECTLVTSPLD
jgi:hypothetical protein